MPLTPPQINGDVRAYDTLQTTAINKNESDITAVKDEIGTPSKIGSILYRLGLIKDYVIEYGSNANGNYEKWVSGKLVQWGTYSFGKSLNTDWGSSSNQAYFEELAKPFPIPFVGDLSKLVFNGTPIHVSGTTPTSHQFRSSLTLTTIPAIYIIKAGPPISSTTNMMVKWNAIGRWKT